MNSLQKSLLSMIKTVISGYDYKAEDGVTAEELYNEACRYEIAGFLSGGLEKFCSGDSEVRRKWSAKAMSDYQKSLFVLSAQLSLCRLLGNDNIKPAILKGTASAYYYSEPLLRHNGDIDFLVVPEQYDRCCEILKSNGYQMTDDGERHRTYSKKGIEYECHRYFTLNSTENDRRTDRMLYDGCRNSVTRSVCGKEFYTLPDAEYGIALLEHLKHHIVYGVGFRQMIDWVMYADSVLDDEIWDTVFVPKARECGLERFAKVITRTAQIYLGLDDGKLTKCRDVEESVCEELTEMIFSCNNFGFTGENEGDVHDVGYIVRTGLLSELDSRAVMHMPIAERVVILRPVAWICQIARWAKSGGKSFFLKKNQPDGYLQKLKKQQKLLKKLGV